MSAGCMSVFIPGQSSVQHHPPTMTSVLTLSFLPLFCKSTIGLFVGQRPDPLPSIRPPADCREFWSTQWASADDKVPMYPEHLQILLFKITLDEQHSVQLLKPTSQYCTNLCWVQRQITRSYTEVNSINEFVPLVRGKVYVEWLSTAWIRARRHSWAQKTDFF